MHKISSSASADDGDRKQRQEAAAKERTVSSRDDDFHHQRIEITGLRHLLFEHSSLNLARRYPRFAKKALLTLLSVEEVFFIWSGGLAAVEHHYRRDAQGRTMPQGATSDEAQCTTSSSSFSSAAAVGTLTEADNPWIGFASETLKAAFFERVASHALLCDAYAFLSAPGQGWILRHAGAMYGAAFIGYRIDLLLVGLHLSTSGDEEAAALRSAAEREASHGETLFLLCHAGVSGQQETTVALRLARSIGKRLLQVSRSAQAPGGFVVESPVQLSEERVPKKNKARSEQDKPELPRRR